MIDPDILRTPEYWTSAQHIDTLQTTQRIDAIGARKHAYRVLSDFLERGVEASRYAESKMTPVDVLFADLTPLGAIACVSEAVVVTDSLPLEPGAVDMKIADRMYFHGVPGLWFATNRDVLKNHRNEGVKPKNPQNSVSMHGPGIKLGKWTQGTRSTGRIACNYRELTHLWHPL